MTPLLLVVTGLPAAGKTTLAQRLAREFSVPLVTKDEFKQILLDNTPPDFRVSENKRVGKASFEVMFHVADVMLRSGTSCIVETHFHRGLSEAHLLGLARRNGARLAQVFCFADLPELTRRHAARVAAGTRPFIDFPSVHDSLPANACWEPLAFGEAPLLRLDTTQADHVTAASGWVRDLLS